jgi:hypothetical protein
MFPFGEVGSPAPHHSEGQRSAEMKCMEQFCGEDRSEEELHAEDGFQTECWPVSEL